MKTDILIVDGNNLAHRSYHSMARLNNKGKPVSIIYGLPILIGSLVKKFKPKKTYIVWDGRRSKVRLSLCPNYKGHRTYSRNFDPVDFYKQRDKVMELFYSIGVKQIYNIKHEADDLIFKLVNKFKNRRVVIASNDKDFHQLITDTVCVYNAKGDILSKSNLSQNFAYNPGSCVDYLCIVGDGSDNIKGYPGIGEVKGREFFEQFSSINNFLDSKVSYKNINKDKLAAIYETNRQLIDLAYYNYFYGSKIKFYKDPNPKFDEKALFKICEDYHILSFRKKQFLRIWKS